MKRVAVILGSPLTESHPDHLRGVEKDVDNYKSFLLSSTGGAWKEDEIKEGWNITKDKVKVIQSLCEGADIALIIFTGHGFMRAGKNYLNLNDAETLGVSEVVTSAKRQITIIDACRTNYPWMPDTGIYGIGMQFDNTRPDIARMLYDYHINQSAQGRITLYSSSPGQPSQEDSKHGGKFTLSLLQEMRTWGNNEFQECLSVKSAFHKSANRIKALNGDQSPQCLYYNETSLSFPFAVSPKAYLKRINGSVTETRTIAVQKSDSGLGKIVVGLAIAVGIGVIISKLGEDD